MKPCSKNRELLASRVLDALDPLQASELDEHIKSCEGCRRFLEELSSVSRHLSGLEIRTDIQTSEVFHQRVRRAVRTERPSAWTTAAAAGWARLLNWRVALPALSVALFIVALSARHQPPSRQVPTGASLAQTILPPKLSREFEPTLSNYQMVANGSLEKLDEMLTHQAARNPAPALVYTASTFHLATVSD